MPRVEVDREEVLSRMVAHGFANEADHALGSEQGVRTREAWASVLNAHFSDERCAAVSIERHVASPVCGASLMDAALTGRSGGRGTVYGREKLSERSRLAA